MKAQNIILDYENQRKIESQHIVIDGVFWAVWAAAIPVPLVEALFIMIVQLKMISRLSFEYRVPFSETRAKMIIAALTAGLATFAFVKSNFLKLIPGIGTFSSQASIVIFTAAITYAIGQVFIKHFESGGTFLDFDENQFKDYFANQYQEGKKIAIRTVQTQSNE